MSTDGEPPTEADRLVAGMDDAAALPRRNGELVFAAPWEARAFGLAVGLCQQGRFGWEDFRGRLIAAIARRERAPEAGWQYYECWQEALEGLLVSLGLVSADALAQRAAEYASGERDEV